MTCQVLLCLRLFVFWSFVMGIGAAHATDYFSGTSAIWKLFKGTSEASTPDPAAWRQLNFDDSSWPNAPSPIFYSTAATEPPFYTGGTFNGTTLNDMLNGYTCVFLRIPFVLGNASSVGQLHFDVVSDDGFVAWINGMEVARQNMPEGNVPFNGVALLSPAEPIPSTNYVFTNSGGLLVNGTNILAVQAFNRSRDSSDFGFMATLSSSLDTTPPVVASVSPQIDATVRALSQITVTFNEPVSNVTANDLLVNGIAASSVATNAPSQFVFSFPQPPLGAVSIAWAVNHGIADLASNVFAGGSWTYLLDTNIPPVSVVISEFMAANGGSLLDEDGDSSDWIEIYNPGPETVALDGWFLTDDPMRLDRWRFPATNVAANSYVLVFASGKDRAIPGARLHTNFKLDADGTYLALVRPDGVIASEWAPTAQRTDISYGIGRETLPSLIVQGAAARVFVPSNDAFGLSWTGGAPFDDSSWLATSTGIGFDQGGAGGGSTAPLGCWTFDDNSLLTQARDSSGHNHHGTIAGAAFTADGGGHSGGPGDRAMNFGPCNNGAFINVTDAATGWFDSATARNTVTFALWIFGDTSEPGINSAFHLTQSADGNAGLYVCNAHLPWTDSIIYWDTGGYAGNQRVSILEPDTTKWKGRWNHYAFVKNGSAKQIWQNGTKILEQTNDDPLRAARGFFIGSGPGGVWSYGGLIDDFAVWDAALSAPQIQALAGGASPLDLDTYGPLLGGDIGPLMRNHNASALVRIPFVVGAIDFDTLLLRMRYDDGYVCWLNGVEIARRNAPATLDWASAATAKRTKNAARTTEELNLSTALSALHPGTNILAFQVLNASAGDTELLLLPELLAVRSTGRLFFTSPTPGAANTGGISGFVGDTHFSTDRGFYFAPTNVVITTATPGAFIVFTRDGTEPTPANGTRVNAVNSSVPPIATVIVAGTTLLRAAAFKEGWRSTDIDTQTYLFPDQVAGQVRPGWVSATWPDGAPADFAMDARVVNAALPGYKLTNALLSIPSLSIVTPSNNLFSAGSGIYANALSSGPSWERAASAELMFPDGRAGFQIDCGIQIHGGSSRYNEFTPKHSFSLLFREVFGAGKLKFPLFTNSPVKQFDQLVLRGCSTDSWPVMDGQNLGGEPWPRWTREEASYLRDQWMRDAQFDLGHASARGLYVHLYLDGLYWGIYNVAERPDDSFAAGYYGGQREEFDVISDANDLHAGTFTAWNEMLALASAGLSTEAALQKIQGNNPNGTRNFSYPVYLDLTNLIDYMILHIASGADDWPIHNWWAARRQGPDSEGFRFFTWDQEIANNSLQRTRTSWSPFPLFADVDTSGTPAFLYAQLRANAEFRVMFGDRIHRHLFNNGQLSVATNIARWQARRTEIDWAMVAESARWGDYRRPAQPYKREVEWLSNQTWMVTTYFPSNLALAVSRFRNANLYPNVGAPSFSQFGGSVSNNYLLTLTHTNGAGATVYYTLDGSDPRLKGGAISPVAQVYSAGIALTSPTLVRARVLQTVWSAMTEAQFHTPQNLSTLQVSEIMYNPPMFGTNDGDEVEFLELKNTGTNTLDLSGLTFTKGIQFTFTNETQLGAGQFFVLARNTALFAAKYSNAPLHGLYSGKLENKGETLTLATAVGATLFTVTYDDKEPWPLAADNTGLSLQRMSFSIAAGNPHNWLAAGPTPGADLPEEWRDDDADGMPNGWEIAHGLNRYANDAALDRDGDGLTNYEELLAGTDPADEVDAFSLRVVARTPPQGLVLGFLARSNRTYSIVWRTPVEASGWTNLARIAAQPIDRFVSVTNQVPGGMQSRFYRLVTPGE